MRYSEDMTTTTRHDDPTIMPVDPEGIIEGAIEACGFEIRGACILTAENMATEDDCTTHEHEHEA
jgi:hypothetical protein